MGGNEANNDDAERELAASKERDRLNRKKVRGEEFDAMQRSKSGFSLADKAKPPGDLLGGQ